MAKKILIVDDDKVIVFIQKRTLQINGLLADTLDFSNGKLALDYLKSQNEESCKYLVLLDISMPVMDGWEFLEAIQEEDFSKQLSVVMLSSSIDKADLLKSSQYSQVLTYIEKPLDAAKCSKIIELCKAK
tara:strand:- start:814 stop:1203 length:390 start_codon:yes stop_codon:yes gene_type:complete